MPKMLYKWLSFLLIISILLVTAPTSFAHDIDVLGGSEWVIGKNNIQATLELPIGLLVSIKEIGDKYTDLNSSSDQQLQQIAIGILKPYIDKKLSVWVNGKKYPVSVDRLINKDSYLYDLILSVNNIDTNSIKSGNSVKIDYRLFFKETYNSHMNFATITSTETNSKEIENVFSTDSTTWEGTIDFDAVSSAKDNSSTSKADMANVPNNSGSSNTQESVNNSSSASQPSNQLLANNSNTTDNNIWRNIGNFILLGIKHILTGYDHILFLLALIVIGLSFKEVLRIVTSFTIAHSITLFLAVMQIVMLNSRFVEVVIAISICYIALENLFRKKAENRWMVTFGFGLIHGFGFASILQELPISKSSLVASVLSFNIGVEVGQLMIFLVMLPILNYLKNRVQFRKVTIGASAVIFVMGFLWLIERLFNRT